MKTANQLNMSELQSLIRFVREKVAVAELDGASGVSNEYKKIGAKLHTQLNYLPEHQEYLKTVRDRINQ